MDNTIEVVTIPKDLFNRMCVALIKVEKILSERQDTSQDWISEEAALKMLGCKRGKLYQFKRTGNVRYKAVGRKHQYSRKSIEKYNELMSS